MPEKMKLIPIKETPEENEEFINNPLCRESIYMSIDFYKKVGFEPPWIGYYVTQNDDLVGAAAFKGKPVNGAVEIAYGTFEQYRKQGVGTAICKLLVDLSLKTDPSVKITARTLPEENFSTRILKKNNFIYTGIVNDPEDGEVWEWVFKAHK
jgi:[ribosomal protein S5]-alanine N-acetyltransferase